MFLNYYQNEVAFFLNSNIQKFNRALIKRACYFNLKNSFIKIKNQSMYLITLLVCALMFLVEQTSAFRFTFGNSSIVQGKFNLTSALDDYQNGSGFLIKRMTLYPYDVFQYELQGSFFNYIFLKRQFEKIQEFLPSSNSTQQLKEKLLLYNIIPEVIEVLSDHNEYLHIDLLEADLQNKKIIIKNGSIENNGQLGSKMNLYVYSLQIHNYLYKIMTKVQSMARKELIEREKEEQQNQFSLSLEQEGGESHFIIQTTQPKQKVSEEDAITKIITETVMVGNQSFWRADYFFNVLFERIMTRPISKNTKYKGLFDGFSLHFLQATILEQVNSQPVLEIINVIKRAGEIKREQIITEPLAFTSFKSIQFLDMCIKQNQTIVIISDRHKGYIIDISNQQWHLLQKIDHDKQGYELIWFNNYCEVFGLDTIEKEKKIENNSTQNQIEQINFTRMIQIYPIQGKKFWEMPSKLEKVYYLQNKSVLLCFFGESLYFILQSPYYSFEKNETSHISIPFSDSSEVHMRFIQDGLNMTTFIEIFNPLHHQQQMIFLDTVPLISDDIQKVFKNFLYDWQVYLNKTKFINFSMDLILFHRTKNSFFNSVLKQQLFGELFSQENENHCFDQQYINLSQLKVQYNQTSPWSDCSIEISTKIYLSLKISLQSIIVTGYKLYICSNYFQKNADPTYIDCSAILQSDYSSLQSKELFASLYNSYFYKIYLIKQSPLQDSHSTKLPILYIKDIQREQIQIASKIFFFIMLSLSLVLITLIFIILLRSIIYNILVYYGHINQRREPTYPLGWFALKTKLKRMQQTGILKFIQYEPSINDTQGNHCCFCLELLNSKSIVAELYCGHEFHRSCFSDWIRNQPNAKCPTCRRLFTAAGLAEYQVGSGSDQDLPL